MPEIISGYEDNYTGVEYETGAALLADLLRFASPDSAVAHWNVPVWVDVHEEAPSRLEVGLLLTRHGEPAIWFTDSFDEEHVDAVRRLLLSVWAHRADAGFPRRPSWGPQRP